MIHRLYGCIILELIMVKCNVLTDVLNDTRVACITGFSFINVQYYIMNLIK